MTAMGELFAQYVYEDKQTMDKVPAYYQSEVQALLDQWRAEATNQATADPTNEGSDS